MGRKNNKKKTKKHKCIKKDISNIYREVVVGGSENINDFLQKEDIKKLCTIYESRMQTKPLTDAIREGIADYYVIISHRGLPAYKWIEEAIIITSKKGEEKRNINYVVGMLRQWLKFGFGHIPNKEEGEVLDYFKEVTGSVASADAVNIIENLMGKYGALKVMRTIPELAQNVEDKSLIKAKELADIMCSKY